MYSNDELKAMIAGIKNLKPKFLDISKNGGYKWQDVRGFQTIIYSEHFESPDQFYDCCRDFAVPCSVSPLHDSDVKDVETGEIKKPHYHFLAYYKGKTSLYRFYTMLCSAFGEDSFFGFDNIANMNMMVRYHCHLDDLDKAQYDVNDIHDFNGFSSKKYLMKMDGDDVSVKSDLKKIIKENCFLFYDELDDYLEDNNFDLYSSLTMNKPLRREIVDYLKSRECRLQYEGMVEKGYTRVKIDDKTDKVIFNREFKAVASS